MTREEKAQVINNITGRLKDADTLYLADISGLNASNTTDLRRACFKADVELMVVKNTLLARAMVASEKEYGNLASVLKGNTSIMTADKGNAPAKIIKNFRKKNKLEKPILKGASIDEAIYIGDENLETLVNIKSKEELVADVISALQSPAKNVISALKNGGGKLAGILKTLSEKEG